MLQNPAFAVNCSNMQYYLSVINQEDTLTTHQKSFVIAVTNLKGGVGKSTISTNLAVSLKHRGFEVCILDTDLGQQSAMEWKGERGDDLEKYSGLRHYRQATQ